MEAITQNDLKTIQRYSGQEPTDASYDELTAIYAKLDYLCQRISKKGFEYSIRKDPRKVAGSNITFRQYQWAKVYPKGLKKACKAHFAYVVGLSDSLHFHMMGVKNYQKHPLSIEASKKSWTELDIKNFNYDSIAEQFVEFDKKYRSLFIETGAGLGVDKCIKLKKELQMDKIIKILELKGQIILQGPPGTGKTYTAKDISEKLIFDTVSDNKAVQKDRLKESNQFTLVQFHPSYTYEDFVRGIEAKTTENGIEYEANDKILSKIAKQAYSNWEKVRSNPEERHKKEWIDDNFQNFLEWFSSEFAEKEDGKYSLTESVYVSEIDEDCFRYRGDNWEKTSRLNFKELKSLIELNISNPDSYEIPKAVSKHAFYRKSYYSAVMTLFFEKTEPYVPSESHEIELKKYVLVIDEINRANLPSVLGELIYALEYRNESMDSMYETEGSSSITIPENLYIIGTMNTADRSVGHIDYAIRRRFAFVNILPNEEPINTSAGKKLFRKVSSLFFSKTDEGIKPSEYLSPDFNYQDVQIGHSYFICDESDLEFKLEYEIKPILREYLKDGILMSTAESVIESLKVES